MPLVQCADCVVPGDLPAHGTYMMQSAAQTESVATHWSVSRAQLDQWLAEGSSVNKEFVDAVIANDVDRAGYLIGERRQCQRTEQSR